ncbi:PTS system, beta-glucosides-specific IIC component [Pilibacter termitis]|uniref:PTS system sucrose-specific EIIBCA component n=1 Tax=Pilibacter termitis TaxID=263852 RepID=A0A1T4MLN5_9ENTE|nr:glucose PTS transporter subunit IIA [Pilibacter termitis]SJZ67658.1 PTS system, beta-glucosides-specific IIC component [Pilibacter termitis]
MDNKTLAGKIIELVGGVDNIVSLTHCVTRLRFKLKSQNLAKDKEISDLEGVLGVQSQAGQYQVIIGANVAKVYKEILSDLPKSLQKENVQTVEKERLFTRILNTLSAILVPSLPPIIGGGMLKGIMFMFVSLKMLDAESGTYFILNITCDAMFYFFPFLVAASAAKRFQTNEYMAMALAGVLLYPSLINAALAGEIKSIRFLDFLSIPVINYSQSILPILLGVLLMKYVYGFLEEHLPSMTTVLLAPLLTLLVMVPILLFAVAPLGFKIGEVVARGIQALIDFSPILSGLVIGTTRPFLVLVGMHHALRPITQQQIATYGFSSMAAMSYLSTMAQATAPFAMYLIVKNKKMKQVALSSTFSGFLGITEPALYGVLVKYKAAFIGASLGGGIGSAVACMFKARAFAPAMPSLLSIPVYLGKGATFGFFLGFFTTIVASFAITTALAKTVFRKDLEEEIVTKEVVEESGVNYEVYSPVQGELVQSSEIPDETFAKEVLGKTVAIMPENNEILSPITGTVDAVFESKHAICLKGEHGEEILVHIGIDTVALGGKYFESLVKKGDKVTVGQKISTVEVEKIRESGYNPMVITIVVNTADYLSVVEEFDRGKIFPKEKILNLIK